MAESDPDSREGAAMQSDRDAGDWLPTANREALAERADLLASIRAFFAARGVLEVETPVLSSAGNSDPGLRQYRTLEPPLWLRTSPEYAMKRLLAAGTGDIFELGRVFRAAEDGRRHNREFTLLEWYRVGWDYRELANEVVELLHHCWPDAPHSTLDTTYRELFIRFAGVDPFSADPDALSERLRDAGMDLPNPAPRECLDLLLSEVIQPQLPESQVTVLREFPADQAALARIRPGDPPVAERFEVFAGGIELANGYQELTDGAEQRRRFDDENRERARHGFGTVPVDQRLLEALDAGLPHCAGVALGVDRLLMLLRRARSLGDVLAFPADRA